MKRLFVVALDDDLVPITRSLGEWGAVQLTRVEDLGEPLSQLTWPEGAALSSQLDGLERRLDNLMEALGIEPGHLPDEPIQVAPEQVIAETNGRLPEIEADAGQIIERQKALQREGERLALAARQLESLAPLAVDLADLRQLSFLHFAAALVPEENLGRLRGSLADTPTVILPAGQEGQRVLVLAIVPRQRQEMLQRVLRSAYAEETGLPPECTGTPAAALEQIQEQVAALNREMAAVGQARTAVAERYRDELLRLQQRVLTNQTVARAWEMFGSTQETRLLAGWVPAAVEPALAASLRETAQGPIIVQSSGPVPVWAAPQDATDPVPTALQDPPVVRPFEILVTTYGIPNYRELNPTALAGFLFVFMFGAMFGDVGHGVIIAVAGWLLARNRLRIRNPDLGWLLFGSGLSAIVFGLLYGTVFLAEETIPALWFRPLRRPDFAIVLAIAFGIGVVSLALILSSVEAYRIRDRARLVLGSRELAGLWFYWGAILSVLALATGRSLPLLAVVVLVLLPLVLMFSREPLQRLWQGAGLREALPGPQEIIQSAIDVLDTVVRYVSNTISFVRLAAFAIAHVGIGLMFFTLAALAQNEIATAALLIVGNIFVLGLEGLVVTIQALRLDYYEFFTKFLQAGGVPFRPFVLPRPDQGDRRRIPGSTSERG